jgi:nitroreductase
MSASLALAPRQSQAAEDPAVLVAELMTSRQTILPKRLLAPGPDADQLQAIWSAAATAPDHGQLLPWRFVLVPPGARASLAEVFAEALRTRDASANPGQLTQAREKAYRSPLLMLAVVDAACGDPEIDLSERILSAGCAVQNMLLMATAQGFGSALTSGKALKSAALRQLFDLSADEHALCFVSIGTAPSRKPARVRPQAHQFSSSLTPTPAEPRRPDGGGAR